MLHTVNRKSFKYIHFDFECTQDEVISCKHGHSPSVCIRCNRAACGSLSADGQSQDCDFGYSPVCDRCHSTFCGETTRVPNFVVAQSTCLHFMENEIVNRDSECTHCGSRCMKCLKHDAPCTQYGYREITFSGLSTADDFGAWLFSEQHKNAIVMAHYMEGYDVIFLLEYLISNEITPEVIFNDSKIMIMTVANLWQREVVTSVGVVC